MFGVRCALEGGIINVFLLPPISSHAIIDGLSDRYFCLLGGEEEERVISVAPPSTHVARGVSNF